MMAENTECRCLREHYDQLVSGIQDPNSLTDTLFARGVISHSVRDEVYQIPAITTDKCRKLLFGVERKLAIEPDTFEVLLTTLEEQPTLAVLANRLKASYALLLKGQAALTEPSLEKCGNTSSGISSLQLFLKNSTKLNLGLNEIGSIGAKQLAQAIAENTTLTHLLLINCQIDTDRMAKLAPGLSNKPLQQLNLSRNQFGSKGLEYLAQAMAENTTLTHLDLWDCGIGADGMAKLAPGLSNTPLQQLNLGVNHFGSKGAEYLAKAMTENTTLTHLDLWDCGIGADGMAKLAPGLSNKPLQQLNLGVNHFGSKGAEYLAQAMTENTNLTHLNLWDCGIGADEMAKLAPGLSNRSLQQLNLGVNHFGSKGAEYLADALKGSSTLTELKVWNCGIDDKEKAYLRETLRDVKIYFDI